ncbi:MAG: MFS transporter, partial [Conexivisphaerales archaeon]
TVSLLLFYSYLGDRIGYRFVLIIAESLLTFSAILLAYTSNLSIIIGAASLGGFGGQGAGGMRGGFGPGSSALVASLYKEQKERLKRISRLTFIGGISSIAGTGLLSLHGQLSILEGNLGAFRILYAASACIAFASAVILSFIHEPQRPKKRSIILTRQSSLFVSKIALSNFASGLGIGLAIPLLPLWFSVFYNFTPTQISVVFTLSSLASAVASLFSSRFPSPIISASLTRLINGLLLIAMAFSHLGWLSALLYIFRGMSAGIGAPSRSVVTLSGIGEDEFGAASSITAIPTRLAMGISALSGYLMLISQELPLALGGVLQAAGGALYYRLLKDSRTSAK